MRKLVIEDDEGKQTIVPLVREEITIGRLDGNTIRLTERNVSRNHARLIRDNGSLFFENTAARYGSKKNGQKVMGRVEFTSGDVFVVGDYRLYLQSDGAAAQFGGSAGSQPTGPQPNAPAPHEATAVIPISQVAPPAPTTPAPVPAPTPAPVPAVAADGGRLVILNTNFAGSEFALPGGEIVIGRTEDNDFSINHRSISRHHAKLTATDSSYRITDLGSANGTKVNNDTYSDIELRRGDIIELGHVKIRYVAPGEVFAFTPGLVDDAPSGGVPKALVVFAVLAVMAAIGVVAMVLSGGEEGTGAADAGTTEDSGAIATETDTGAVAPEPDVEQTAVVDHSQTIRDAERLLSQANWDAALDLLLSVPVDDPNYAEADQKQIRARRERSTRDTLYNPALEAEQAGEFAVALDRLSEIPEDSYYRQLADEQSLVDRISSAWFEAASESANTAMSDNRFADARSALNEYGARYETDERVGSQLALITAAETEYDAAQAERDAERQAERERERELERERERQPDPPDEDDDEPEPPDEDDDEPEREPEPEVDVDDLIRQAQRLGLRRQHSEAIELLEQAARLERRNSRIQMMLYRNYAGLGRNRDAARSLERYLDLRPNDPNADEYRETIETLRN